MVSLGCAILEMLLPGKVQLATCGLTGKQRETAIAKLCQSNDKLLPRFVTRADIGQLVVKALFSDEKPANCGNVGIFSLGETLMSRNARNNENGKFDEISP